MSGGGTLSRLPFPGYTGPMNEAEKLLLEKSANPDALFVFPTDVALSRWTARLLELQGGGAVGMEQFRAWDSFKRDSIRSRKQDRTSVPPVLRKVFVRALLRENAEICGAGGEPLFRSLIPPRYAGEAAAFASWLASILPQLGAWQERIAEHPGIGEDEADLLVLARRYREFLDANGLFEPAWERPPFDDSGKDVYLFFPECLSDFEEYRELLERSGHVTLVHTPPLESGAAAADAEKGGGVFFHPNSRSEIARAARYIRALAEEGRASWDGIVVSIPEDAAYEACVLREFANRNIPLVRRSGKALLSYPAGQFFSALGDCYSGGFSFDSLAALLLNSHLPWKDTGAINQLVNFGMENNCIAS
jgi:hypothetical protein